MRRPWRTLRATNGSSAGTPSQSRIARAAAPEREQDAAPRPAAPPQGPDGAFQRASPVPRLARLLLWPLFLSRPPCSFRGFCRPAPEAAKSRRFRIKGGQHASPKLVLTQLASHGAEVGERCNGIAPKVGHIRRINGESGSTFVAVGCCTRANGESGATL